MIFAKYSFGFSIYFASEGLNLNEQQHHQCQVLLLALITIELAHELEPAPGQILLQIDILLHEPLDLLVELPDLGVGELLMHVVLGRPIIVLSGELVIVPAQIADDLL